MLKLTWYGCSIHDVLEMTVIDALDSFAAVEDPRKRGAGIGRDLQFLVDVGVGYLRLDQSLSTLSGGEAQRLKLAAELTRTGNVYVMDEPTTGLHPADIDCPARHRSAHRGRQHGESSSSTTSTSSPLPTGIVDLGPEGGRDGGANVAGARAWLLTTAVMVGAVGSPVAVAGGLTTTWYFPQHEHRYLREGVVRGLLRSPARPAECCGRDLMIEQTDLLGRLERVEKSRGGWTARCPAHDDREISLSIWHEDEVRWRLECRVGCTPEKIAGAIEIAVSQLQADQVVRYRYDESYEVVRIGMKDFRQRRRDDGGWTFDMTGVAPRLYGFKALRKASPASHGRPVIVVEREEYVNRLVSRLGDRMLATCCPGGLGKWEATHIEQLKDAGVVQVAVIPDDDAESRADAHAVACAFHAAGLNVRVIDLPSPVKDVSAYLDRYKGNDLAALVEAAPQFTGPVPTRLSEVSAEPVSWLWLGWIPEGSVTVLDGNPGVGKTLITFDLAARVSTGRTMPDGQPGPGKPAAVVLVTRDDVTGTVMPRLDIVGADMTRIDHLPRDGDHLPTDADLGTIFGAVVAAKARLVVLDPLLSIVPPSDASYTDQDLRNTLTKLARLAARTRTAVLVTRDLYWGKEDQMLERGDGIRTIGGVWTRLVAGPDPADDRRAVLRRMALDRSTKSVASVQFAVVVVNAAGVPAIAWDTPPHAHESTPRRARPRRQRRPALDVAVEFLRELLADGPLSMAEVAQAADSAGITIPTLRRAKSLLEIESKKQGQPGSDSQAWMWVLPPKVINMHRM